MGTARVLLSLQLTGGVKTTHLTESLKCICGHQWEAEIPPRIIKCPECDLESYFNYLVWRIKAND
jgi:hypothetical protein